MTPTQWIAAWDYVTGLIGSIASNATFVWAPNIEAGAVSFAQYWPGNAHVGAVGLDGYYGNTWANWSNSFAKSVADLRALNTLGMLFIVAETGIPNTDASAVAQADGLFAGARSAGAASVPATSTVASGGSRQPCRQSLSTMPTAKPIWHY